MSFTLIRYTEYLRKYKSEIKNVATLIWKLANKQIKTDLYSLNFHSYFLLLKYFSHLYFYYYRFLVSLTFLLSFYFCSSLIICRYVIYSKQSLNRYRILCDYLFLVLIKSLTLYTSQLVFIFLSVSLFHLLPFLARFPCCSISRG